MDIDIKMSGKLIFDPKNMTKKHNKQSSWKKTAMIMLNDDTSHYYRYLIEKRFPLIQGVNGDTNWINVPLRKSHVTIINDKVNDGIWNKLKSKWNYTSVDFFYNWGGLRNNGEHLYFKVDSPMAQSIRDDGNLGDPYYGFHLTIGHVPEDSLVKSSHLKEVRNYMLNLK